MVPQWAAVSRGKADTGTSGTVCWKGFLPTAHFHLPSLQGGAGLQPSHNPGCSSASTGHMDLDPGLSLDSDPDVSLDPAHLQIRSGATGAHREGKKTPVGSAYMQAPSPDRQWMMAIHIQPISQLPQSSSRASPGHLLHWLGEEVCCSHLHWSTEVTRVIC